MSRWGGWRLGFVGLGIADRWLLVRGVGGM